MKPIREWPWPLALAVGTIGWFGLLGLGYLMLILAALIPTVPGCVSYGVPWLC